MKYELVMPQDCRCKMRNNAKGIGRSNIKLHEGIRAVAGGSYTFYKAPPKK